MPRNPYDELAKVPSFEVSSTNLRHVSKPGNPLANAMTSGPLTGTVCMPASVSVSIVALLEGVIGDSP